MSGLAGSTIQLASLRRGFSGVEGLFRSGLRQQDSERPHADLGDRIQVIAVEQDADGRGLGGVVLDAVDGRERRRHVGVEFFEAGFELGLFGIGSAAQLALQAAHLLLHRVGLGLPGVLLFFAGQDDVVRLSLREVGLQAVVVGLAEGIELVVVAAGAADGDAEEGRADDVGHLGEDFVLRAGHVLVAGILAERAEAVEAAGHQVGLVGGIHLVAGELLLDEIVVRLVVVEALDDVIAVAVGVGAMGVVLVAVGLGEADHVEPVAAPLLAVMRRGEQAVDHLFPGIGRLVAHEVVDFLRAWAAGR